MKRRVNVLKVELVDVVVNAGSFLNKNHHIMVNYYGNNHRLLTMVNYYGNV